MNTNEIYMRTYSADKLCTRDELKDIFETELGGAVEFDEDDATVVRVYPSARKQACFQITVTLGTYGNTFAIAIVNPAGNNIGTRTLSPTSGNPQQSIYYIKFPSGDFLFGISVHAAAAASSSINFRFACATGKNIYDEEELSDVVYLAPASSTATRYFADAKTTYSVAMQALTNASDYIQLAPLITDGGYVCENVYKQTHGRRYTHAKFVINDEEYYMDDSVNITSGAPSFLYKM
jgi:hypothetical protein